MLRGIASDGGDHHLRSAATMTNATPLGDPIFSNPIFSKTIADSFREGAGKMTAETETKWYLDDKRRKTFWQSANNIAKSKGVPTNAAHEWVHLELGISTIKDWTDTPEAALKILSDAPEWKPEDVADAESPSSVPLGSDGKPSGDLNDWCPPAEPAKQAAPADAESKPPASEPAKSVPTEAQISSFKAEASRLYHAADDAISNEGIAELIKADTGLSSSVQALVELGHDEAIRRIKAGIAKRTLPKAEEITINDQPPANSRSANSQARPSSPANTTTALTLTGDTHWDAMKQQAEIMVRSGFMPKDVNTPEKVMTIGMMSEALGIPMIVGINNIDVIQGKPTVKPHLMLALIENSGKLEDMSITDDGETCTVVMKRKGRSPHTETFGMDDAKRMMTKEWDSKAQQSKTIPLAEKFNWKSQPKTMRKWRAISACARVLFSDVIMGFYTPEELDPDVIVEAA